MASPTKIAVSTQVIEFPAFWRWLQNHPNCILSAGTADIALFDNDDFHWHLGGPSPPSSESEAPSALLVQLIRGKQLIAEMLIDPSEISYVQVEQKGEEEFLFECVVEDPEGIEAVYTFNLSHGFDQEEPPQKGRWVH